MHTEFDSLCSSYTGWDQLNPESKVSLLKNTVSVLENATDQQISTFTLSCFGQISLREERNKALAEGYLGDFEPHVRTKNKIIESRAKSLKSSYFAPNAQGFYSASFEDNHFLVPENAVENSTHFKNSYSKLKYTARPVYNTSLMRSYDCALDQKTFVKALSLLSKDSAHQPLFIESLTKKKQLLELHKANTWFSFTSSLEDKIKVQMMNCLKRKWTKTAEKSGLAAKEMPTNELMRYCSRDSLSEIYLFFNIHIDRYCPIKRTWEECVAEKNHLLDLIEKHFAKHKGGILGSDEMQLLDWYLECKSKGMCYELKLDEIHFDSPENPRKKFKGDYNFAHFLLIDHYYQKSVAEDEPNSDLHVTASCLKWLVYREADFAWLSETIPEFETIKEVDIHDKNWVKEFSKKHRLEDLLRDITDILGFYQMQPENIPMRDQLVGFLMRLPPKYKDDACYRLFSNTRCFYSKEDPLLWQFVEEFKISGGGPYSASGDIYVLRGPIKTILFYYGAETVLSLSTQLLMSPSDEVRKKAPFVFEYLLAYLYKDPQIPHDPFSIFKAALTFTPHANYVYTLNNYMYRFIDKKYDFSSLDTELDAFIEKIKDYSYKTTKFLYYLGKQALFSNDIERAHKYAKWNREYLLRYVNNALTEKKYAPLLTTHTFDDFLKNVKTKNQSALALDYLHKRLDICTRDEQQRFHFFIFDIQWTPFYDLTTLISSHETNLT